MPKPLIALLAIALAACTGGGGGGSPSSGTDVTTPGTAVISDHTISSDAITIAWTKTEGADAESWSAYHNDSATCSAELNASDDNQQSGSCSFTLTDGNNSIYVQLCNSGDACSTSDTLQIEHSLAPGAIYLEQLPSSTSSNQLEVTWIKEQGTNGDLWYIFHNGQSACSGSFALPSEQQPRAPVAALILILASINSKRACALISRRTALMSAAIPQSITSPAILIQLLSSPPRPSMPSNPAYQLWLPP